MTERQPVGLPFFFASLNAECSPTNAPAAESSISLVETTALRLKRYTVMKFLRADAR